MQNRRAPWVGAFSLAFVVGCSSQTLNVGSGDVDGASEAEVLTGPTVPIPGATLCTQAASAGAGGPDLPEVAPEAGTTWTSLLGTWTGSWTGPLDTDPSAADAPSAPSMVLSLASQTDGTIAGTVRFGEAPPPAGPATALGAYAPLPPKGGATTVSFDAPFDGFVYAAHRLASDGAHVTLNVLPSELLAPWCAVQASYDWGQGQGCGCLPNWAGGVVDAASSLCAVVNPATQANDAIPCNQVGPCTTLGAAGAGAYPFVACVCSIGSCKVDLRGTPWAIHLALSTAALEGTVVLGAASVSVHLTPAP
jgi:hypothetical protein